MVSCAVRACLGAIHPRDPAIASNRRARNPIGFVEDVVARLTRAALGVLAFALTFQRTIAGHGASRVFHGTFDPLS